MIERDLAAVPPAVRRFRESHSSDELFLAVARFALLAYAPSQHAKHAMLSCLAAYELREELGDRFDDVVTECAIYAAASRQPWSEPPIMDPPPIEADQRGDHEELLAAIDAGDRHRGERWLAKRLEDADLARDYFAAAARDFEDLGHKLIVATAAWKLVPILGERGKYATLRTAIWELTAYRDDGGFHEQGIALPAETLLVRLIDHVVREQGSIVSAHAVFLLDAALEAGSLAKDDLLTRRVRDYLTVYTDECAGGDGLAGEAPSTIPVYRLARDYGECLKAFAVAKRLRSRFPAARVDRLVAAACYNLEHGQSFEEWSFA
jgi:hypothetical protein